MAPVGELHIRRCAILLRSLDKYIIPNRSVFVNTNLYLQIVLISENPRPEGITDRYGHKRKISAVSRCCRYAAGRNQCIGADLVVAHRGTIGASLWRQSGDRARCARPARKKRLVSRLRGRGTTVSPPKITRRFAPLYRFERDLTEQGVAFETRVLSFDAEAPVPSFVRERLRLADEATVGSLSLVRVVDDRIVCHDRRFYPPPEISGRFNPELVETEDASRVLEGVVGSPVVESIGRAKSSRPRATSPPRSVSPREPWWLPIPIRGISTVVCRSRQA